MRVFHSIVHSTQGYSVKYARICAYFKPMTTSHTIEMDKSVAPPVCTQSIQSQLLLHHSGTANNLTSEEVTNSRWDQCIGSLALTLEHPASESCAVAANLPVPHCQDSIHFCYWAGTSAHVQGYILNLLLQRVTCQLVSRQWVSYGYTNCIFRIGILSCQTLHKQQASASSHAFASKSGFRQWTRE